MSKPPQTAARNLGLDVLRGVAILLVLGAHLDFSAKPPDLPKLFLDAWASVGWAGVDLFFVLSGFLVSDLLFKEWKKTGELRIFRFLVRRGYKIYPSFYLYLIWTVLWAFPFQMGYGEQWFHAFLSEAFFLQNYWAKFWPHTWSLAVEEHFYLLLSLLLFLMIRFESRKNPFRRIPWVFLAIALIALGWRWSIVANGVTWFGNAMLPTHLRMDSLFFGVLISYFFNFHEKVLRPLASRKGRILLGLAAGLCLTPLFLLEVVDPWLESAGLTSCYLGFGALLLLALSSGKGARSQASWPVQLMAVIGRSSYSIYLWHIAARTWAKGLLRLSYPASPPYWWLEGGTFLVGSILVGYFLTRFVEIPILRYRDRNHPAS